jgi:hypothetical protein
MRSAAKVRTSIHFCAVRIDEIYIVRFAVVRFASPGKFVRGGQGAGQ